MCRAWIHAIKTAPYTDDEEPLAEEIKLRIFERAIEIGIVNHINF